MSRTMPVSKAERDLGNVVASTFNGFHKAIMILTGASPVIGMSWELYRQLQNGDYNRAAELGAIELVLTGITSLSAYGIYKLSAPKHW